MRARLQWAAVVVGAAAFSVLLVWLYDLIGNAVWLPLGIAALAYVDIRLTGIAEQMHTDLVEELDAALTHLDDVLDKRLGKTRDRG